jgi:hypothetical protein
MKMQKKVALTVALGIGLVYVPQLRDI